MPKIEPGYHYLAKCGQVYGPIKTEKFEGEDVFFCPHTQQGFYEDGKAWGRLDRDHDLLHKVLQIKVDGSWAANG